MGGRGKGDPNAGSGSGEGSAEAVEAVNALASADDLKKLLGLESSSSGGVAQTQLQNAALSVGDLAQSSGEGDAEGVEADTAAVGTGGPKRRGKRGKPKKSQSEIVPQLQSEAQPLITSTTNGDAVPEVLTAPVDIPVQAVVEGHTSSYSELSSEAQTEVLAGLNKFYQDLLSRKSRRGATGSNTSSRPRLPQSTIAAPLSSRQGRSRSRGISGPIARGGTTNTTGIRRDQTLFPYLKPKDVLNHAPLDPATGKPMTAQAYRKSFTTCFYCDQELYHDYVKNDSRDPNKTQRRSILEHVYANDLAIQYAPDGGRAEQEAQQKRSANILESEIKPPTWWQDYARDARGQVCACSRCNGSKGTKSIVDWRPDYSLRPGAKEEATEKFNFIKNEYGFTVP